MPLPFLPREDRLTFRISTIDDKRKSVKPQVPFRKSHFFVIILPQRFACVCYCANLLGRLFYAYVDKFLSNKTSREVFPGKRIIQRRSRNVPPPFYLGTLCHTGNRACRGTSFARLGSEYNTGATTHISGDR